MACMLKLVASALMRLADSRKADELKHYVDWAVAHGLGVIDVNLPKYLTGIDVWSIVRYR